MYSVNKILNMKYAKKIISQKVIYITKKYFKLKKYKTTNSLNKQKKITQVGRYYSYKTNAKSMYYHSI